VIGVQIGLFFLGIWLMRRVVITVGASEVRSPSTVFAGIVLAMQLPIAVGMGFAAGGAEGIKANREGIDPSIAAARMQKKYWWLDLAVPGTAVAIGGLILLSGLRQIQYVPPPPDEPVGITDHRAVMAEKWAENDRLVRRRNRDQSSSTADSERELNRSS
jgi:hypothetical protein